ncbi:SixA phosphatase family protein [Kordiimonas gwangyangensis]|uniref:SixA phosphatase family protein n=1 Tax=Kordiimonas gwangyangensis TaxID=288022 RepID=UPI00036250DA|nr:histidine phosphatase family protein [Kordiimonas gwangyangensis]
MANLYLLRHAKSDWGDPKLSDHDRVLSERGIKDAGRMGRALARQSLAPEIVICSTATRARQTLELVMDAGGFDWQVQYEPSLYMASVSNILSVIKSDAGECASALLVGHNPGFHSVALDLIRTGAPELVHALDYKYPTGTFAEITFDEARLGDVEPSTGALKQFLKPKDQTKA